MEKREVGELELRVKKLVYWEQNGEMRVAEDVLNWPKREVIATFHAKMERFGHWFISIFYLNGKYYAKYEWIPAPGYSWDEVKVYELETAGPFITDE